MFLVESLFVKISKFGNDKQHVDVHQKFPILSEICLVTIQVVELVAAIVCVRLVDGFCAYFVNQFQKFVPVFEVRTSLNDPDRR